MKTVKVNGQEVQLNNMVESDELTPKVVRAALRTVYGNTHVKSVVDDGNKAYTVTRGGNVRKMSAAQEGEYRGW